MLFFLFLFTFLVISYPNDRRASILCTQNIRKKSYVNKLALEMKRFGNKFIMTQSGRYFAGNKE